MPKLPDPRLLGLLAVPLLHAPAAGPLPRRSPPVPSGLRETSRRHRPAPLTLKRLSVLEEDIVLLRYKLAIAKLRHELTALRSRPHPPPVDATPPIPASGLAVRPVSPSGRAWRVLAVVGRAGDLQAVVGRRRQRRTVTAGARLGRARVVRVSPAGVWIVDGGRMRRLPVTICRKRIDCTLLPSGRPL